jgi:monothiol glutaredoxin
MIKNDIFKTIKKQLDENDVVLYMKGTPEMPQCGFSGTVVHILKLLNVNFKSIDILSNQDIRQGIKDFTNWPTVPQLYIKGEFIGGCDIVKEMYTDGTLEALLKAKKIDIEKSS